MFIFRIMDTSYKIASFHAYDSLKDSASEINRESLAVPNRNYVARIEPNILGR